MELTEGNREEAARLLGIGERTLYRVIQDWKLQDRIRQALDRHGGDMALAAKDLGLTARTLERKLKKMSGDLVGGGQGEDGGASDEELPGEVLE